jgi:hypothetical protein
MLSSTVEALALDDSGWGLAANRVIAAWENPHARIEDSRPRARVKAPRAPLHFFTKVMGYFTPLPRTKE